MSVINKILHAAIELKENNKEKYKGKSAESIAQFYIDHGYFK